MFAVEFALDLPSLTRRIQDQAQERRVRGPKLVAAEWQNLLDFGEVESRAALSRRMGISRARVTQELGTAR